MSKIGQVDNTTINIYIPYNFYRFNIIKYVFFCLFFTYSINIIINVGTLTSTPSI